MQFIEKGFCKYLRGRVLNNLRNIPWTDKACYAQQPSSGDNRRNPQPHVAYLITRK